MTDLAMAAQQDNKLALPSHLSRFMKEQGGDDFGHLTQSDFGVSFLKVCQGTSREIAVGPSGEPAVPMGAVFNRRDRKMLPVGTNWIPLCRSVKYIKWEGKPGDGRMIFQTSDENDQRIKSIRGLEFRKDPRSGESMPPLVTAYTNFYVYVQGFTEPVLLSFCRASAGVGKRLTQDLFRLTHGNKLPMWTTIFSIQPSVLRQLPGKQWYEFVYKFESFLPENTTEETIKRIQSMYEMAILLRDASTGDEFVQAEEDQSEPQQPASLVEAPAPVQEPLKNCTPAQPAPAPIQQQVQPQAQAAPAAIPANVVRLF